jgi:hypothetical protein
VASGKRAKVFSFHIVPLGPAYKAGLAGYVPVKEGYFLFGEGEVQDDEDKQ